MWKLSFRNVKKYIYFPKNVNLGISWRTAAVCVPFLYLEKNVPKAVPVRSSSATLRMDAQIASIIVLEPFYKADKNLHLTVSNNRNILKLDLNQCYCNAR